MLAPTVRCVAASLTIAAFGCSRAPAEPVDRVEAGADAGCLERSPYMTKWIPVTPKNQTGADVPCTWVLFHTAKGPVLWVDPSLAELPK